MNVLLIPSSYPNTYNPLSAQFYRDHAKALQSVGHNVTVLAVIPISIKSIFNKRRLDFTIKSHNDKGINTFVITFPSIPKCRLLNNHFRYIIARNIFNKIGKYVNFDIVHVHGFLAGDIARYIKTKYKIPYIVTEHSTAFARSDLSFSQTKLAQRVFKDADCCTAVSIHFSKLLNSRYGLNFKYTPNSVDLSEVQSYKRIKSNKNGVIKICNIGFMHSKKNQGRLIKSFARLLQIDHNLELHIVGSGPEMKNLQILVKKLGISDNITFHGNLNRMEVFKILSDSDIFALSSDYETFGVVIIEAMAYGVPVVSTRCGGPEGIIVNHKLGVLTDKTDEAFYSGLRAVLSNLNQSFYNSDYIENYAKRNYSLFAVGKNFDMVFRWVLKKMKEDLLTNSL